MNVATRKKLVVLGLMSRMPYAGVVWQTIHYLIGFARLGYDVYYVEAHGITPTKLMLDEHDDGALRAAAFIAAVMQRLDMGDRWAFHSRYPESRYFGLTDVQLGALYDSAALVINLHGGTVPLPEHRSTDRLIYLETDPVEVQIQLHENRKETIEFLEPHCAFFTFGENYGKPDCLLPVSERFHFRPTRQPVVPDLWEQEGGGGELFTTVANWRQSGRNVQLQGETYRWSKHHEFLKFIDLPRRTPQSFELSLSQCDGRDRQLLLSKGWKVRDALSFSTDSDAYRRYIVESRGEFTVAKDQNVRLRTGWFSDRSATYLAAGRPVITQETGFSGTFPTGHGLFAFSSMEEIVDAVERVNSAYEEHGRAARTVAREYFTYDVVLPRLLSEVGL